MNETKWMYIQTWRDIMSWRNLTTCPICGAALKNGILQGKCDELIIHCTHCGKYAMSYEFYQDHVAAPNSLRDAKRIERYLLRYKNKGTLVCLCNCKVGTSEKYHCIVIRT